MTPEQIYELVKKTCIDCSMDKETSFDESAGAIIQACVLVTASLAVSVASERFAPGKMAAKAAVESVRADLEQAIIDSLDRAESSQYEMN